MTKLFGLLGFNFLILHGCSHSRLTPLADWRTLIDVL